MRIYEGRVNLESLVVVLLGLVYITLPEISNTQVCKSAGSCPVGWVCCGNRALFDGLVVFSFEKVKSAKVVAGLCVFRVKF